MDRAGLENMLMNYYRSIDRSKIQFDFLTHRPNEGAYENEIKSLGGKIYRAPRLLPQNYGSYVKYMNAFFTEHPEYTIIHSHIDSMSFIPLSLAKKRGIPVRIAHSHSTSVDFNYKIILKELYRYKLRGVATNFAACSKKAGIYLFGKNKDVKVIPNAIDLNKYKYSIEIRNKKRIELGVEDKFVIGHVGRFSKPKNHKFLIEVFKEVSKIDDKAILLLVGEGELEKEIHELIYKYRIENKVVHLKERDDVNELYQAMDLLAFPSLYEGLPMVAVEAQSTGLKCLISDKITKEAIISDQSIVLPLHKDIWIREILDNRMKYDRKSVYSKFFDIEIAARRLEEYYESLT